MERPAKGAYHHKKLLLGLCNTERSPVVTTNFRPYEVAILHAVADVSPDIPVIWCDTGYNTPQTYRHAEELIARLGLNIKLYVPAQTVAHRDVVMGIPDIDDPLHKVFTEQVKLEPFQRAHGRTPTGCLVYEFEKRANRTS